MKSSIQFCLIVAFASVLIAKAYGDDDQVCAGTNEMYTSCGSSCPETCETLFGNAPARMCTMECVAGCFCEDGYVRNTVTDKCVRKEHCKMPRDEIPIEGKTVSSAQTSIVSIAATFCGVFALILMN